MKYYIEYQPNRQGFSKHYYRTNNDFAGRNKNEAKVYSLRLVRHYITHFKTKRYINHAKNGHYKIHNYE